MKTVVGILSCLLLVSLGSCAIGVAWGPNAYTSADYKCAVQNGYTHAAWFTPSTIYGINRAFTVDTLQTIKNSGAVTQLIFAPCKNRNVARQVSDFLQRIPKNLYTKLWLYGDDESDDQTCQWLFDGDKANNCRLMHEFANEFRRNNIHVGIVSNDKFLSDMYGSCTQLGAYQLLWFPLKPDGVPNFNDFKPFGGWTKVAKKVYNFSTVCGILDAAITYQP